MSRQKNKETALSDNMQNLALRTDDFAGDELDEYSETGIEVAFKLSHQDLDESYGGFDGYALGV